MDRIPDEVRTARLLLRRWRDGDAPLLHEAVIASLEHLRPWMRWVAFEPLSVEDRARLIVDWADAAADTDAEAIYGVFCDGAVVGGCGLHRRAGPDTLEIGYWIHADHVGQGYATELARGLTSAAFTVDGIERVEIHHDKANTRSSAVPQKARVRTWPRSSGRDPGPGRGGHRLHLVHRSGILGGMSGIDAGLRDRIVGRLGVGGVIGVAGVLLVAIGGGAIIGLSPVWIVVLAAAVIGLAFAWLVGRTARRSPERAPGTVAVLGHFVIAGVVVLAVIQVIPYGRAHSNPPVTGEPAWSSPRTRELMVNACYDCHSNEVEWPWYASVAPFSWAVTEHVDEGRRKVNYSEFTTGGGHEADETIEVILDGEMPPYYFTLFGLHPEADLSPDEVTELVAGLRATPGFGDGEGDDEGEEREREDHEDDDD